MDGNGDFLIAVTMTAPVLGWVWSLRPGFGAPNCLKTAFSGILRRQGQRPGDFPRPPLRPRRSLRHQRHVPDLPFLRGCLAIEMQMSTLDCHYVGPVRNVSEDVVHDRAAPRRRHTERQVEDG